MAKKKQKPVARPEVTGPGGVPIRSLSSDNDFLNCCQLWVGGPGTGKTSTFSALGTVADSLGLEGVRPFVYWFEQGATKVAVEGTNEVCPDCKGKGCDSCGNCGVIPLILAPDKSGPPCATIDEWFEWGAKSEFNPIAIDTGNAYFRAVSAAICLQNGVVSAVESKDMGITWTQIFQKVQQHYSMLRSAGKTLIYLMHEYEQTKRTKGGEITERIAKIQGASNGFLKGSAHQILHFDIIEAIDDEEEDKGVIHCVPFAGMEAKDRWGILPDKIDRGSTPEEGAKALLECFYEFKD